MKIYPRAHYSLLLLHEFLLNIGGANRRGDAKWPPESYKQQSEVDNEARRRLALGPAFRPKRVNRVIRSFIH